MLVLFYEQPLQIDVVLRKKVYFFGPPTKKMRSAGKPGCAIIVFRQIVEHGQVHPGKLTSSLARLD